MTSSPDPVAPGPATLTASTAAPPPPPPLAGDGGQDGGASGGEIFGNVLGVITIVFAPTIVALARRHHNAAQIFLVNLLLGWTGLGWIVALIWAAGQVRRAPVAG